MMLYGPGGDEKKYRNFFFQNLLIVLFDIRAISGEDFYCCFAPKKVWRPLSISWQNIVKIYIIAYFALLKLL